MSMYGGGWGRPSGRKHLGPQPAIQYKDPNDIDDTLSFVSLKGRVQRCLAGSRGASTCA